MPPSLSFGLRRDLGIGLEAKRARFRQAKFRCANRSGLICGLISEVIDGHAWPGGACGANVFGCGGKSCLQERSRLKAGGIYHAGLCHPGRGSCRPA